MTDRASFERELRESGWVHFPLPLHRELSLEAEGGKKRILESRKIDLSPGLWKPIGECGVTAKGGLMRLETALYYPRRPHGDLELGDCSNYGVYGAECAVGRENW